MSSLRQRFLAHVAQTNESPLMLEITSSKGMYLYDSTGKAYMDLIAGIGVSCLGHRYPAVIKACKKQLDLYLHTLVYGEPILSPQVQLAELLAKNLPETLNSVYFVNSGSEAVEGAMKLAKRFTGRTEIIAAKNAYHGSTHGATSLMSDKVFTQAYRPLLPAIRHITFNCENCLKKITEETACVFIETVQAARGVQVPTNDYLKKLRKRCIEKGVLLVFDEIQTGMGRTGTLFSFEQYKVVPDVLLLAKGLGGGMPIGAFIASKEIMNVLSFNPSLGYITTFGGHPVNCAAALATLQTLLKKQKLVKRVKKKADLFKRLLVHPKIMEIRNAGLLMAVELESFEMVEKVCKRCLENGLITDWFLFNDRSVRIAPPLIIKKKEIRKACKIILEAIDFSTKKE